MMNEAAAGRHFGAAVGDPPTVPYRYRCLPCTLGMGTRATHSICGVDRQGGVGVLEWCYGKHDAESMLVEMSTHVRFHSLRIGDGNGY